ncbi:MAG: restriction endonuclease subunit S [Micrococcaceae bacterium]
MKKSSGSKVGMNQETRLEKTKHKGSQKKWQSARFGEVVTFRSGSILTRAQAGKGTIPVIAGGKTPSSYTNEPNRLDPTITISASGANAGYVAIHFSPIFASDCTTISASSSFDLQFIFYSLSLKQDLIYRSQTGGAQPHIHAKDIAPLIFELPQDPEEQREIGNMLSDVDCIIASLEQLIAKKQGIKQGMMQQLLTGQTRLPGFAQDWTNRKLYDMLEYEQPGRYIVSSTDYTDTGTPVLTAGKTFLLGHTRDMHGVYNNVPVIIFDDFTTASKYVNFPFKAKSSAMKILRARPGTNLRYIFERMQLINFVAVDHKRRWIAEYSKIRIEIPDEDEQRAIAEVLSDADSEITSLQEKLAKIKELKKGMMQQLLTGRIRLHKEDKQ